MAKVTGPVLSLTAAKSLMKTVTYQKRPSGHAVYLRSHPGRIAPFIVSETQKAQRIIIGNLVAQWKALSKLFRDNWDEEAKEVGYIGTGYHYFIHMKGGLIISAEWDDAHIAWDDAAASWDG